MSSSVSVSVDTHWSGLFIYTTSEDHGSDSNEQACQQASFYKCELLCDIPGTQMKKGEKLPQIQVDTKECWIDFSPEDDLQGACIFNFKAHIQLIPNH
jgi:hypothetical protein